MTLVDGKRAEGRHTDPFDRHEARWMSNGEPAKLVRDAGADSFDAPPDEAPSHEAVRIEHPEGARTGDLLRADSAQTGKPFDEADMQVAILDAFARTNPIS